MRLGLPIFCDLIIARPAASMDEIILAAQQAQIHEFIQALPQGYETPIGEQASN